jgi:hypothetical protein
MLQFIIFQKTRQMTAFFSKKLTVMIIAANFVPLLLVFVKYMLQFDDFFAKQSTMNTKGMSLLPRGSPRILASNSCYLYFLLAIMHYYLIKVTKLQRAYFNLVKLTGKKTYSIELFKKYSQCFETDIQFSFFVK